MDDAGILLARMEAPEALREWAARKGLEEAFAEASAPADIVWLAGAASLDLSAAFAAVRAEIRAHGEESAETREISRRVETALAEALETRMHEPLLALAAQLEEAQSAPPRTLREAPSTRFPVVARASAFLLRGAEALYAARQHEIAERLARAQIEASLVGGGASMFMGGHLALRLDAERLPESAFDAQLLVVVVALVAAVDELVRDGRRSVGEAVRQALYEADFG